MRVSGTQGIDFVIDSFVGGDCIWFFDSLMDVWRACRVSGQQSQAVVEGSAQLRKASIYCPHLKYPMTNVHADIHMANNRLQVRSEPGTQLVLCLA